MARWFRFYDDVVNDPKVQRLPAPMFKLWINLLCIASKCGGTLPVISDIAFALRISEGKVLAAIDELAAAGLLDKTDAGLEPHNWHGRQYESDGAAERMKRYRDKRQSNGLNRGTPYTKHLAALMERDGGACIYCRSTEKLVIDHMEPIQQGGTDEIDNLGMACKRCNSGKAGRTPEQAGYTVTWPQALEALLRYRASRVAVTVTAQNRIEQSQIQNRTEQNRVDAAPPSAAPAADRATRLKIEALPDDWRAFCSTERKDLPPDYVWQRFRDYWTAKPGKDGRKLDWLATWRNWVRSERAPPGQPPPSLFAQPESEAVKRWKAESDARHRSSD